MEGGGKERRKKNQCEVLEKGSLSLGRLPLLPLLSGLASWASCTVHCFLCILLCAYIKVTTLLYSTRAPGSTALAFCMLNPLLHTYYLCWLRCYLCLCHFNKSFQAAFELSRHYPSPQPFASL